MVITPAFACLSNIRFALSSSRVAFAAFLFSSPLTSGLTLSTICREENPSSCRQSNSSTKRHEAFHSASSFFLFSILPVRMSGKSKPSIIFFARKRNH